MRVSYAHLCDYAMVSSEGKITAVGIFHSLAPTQLPVTVPVAALAFEIEGERGDLGREIRLEIRLRDSAKRTLGGLQSRFVPAGELPPGAPLYIPQAIMLAGWLRFASAGTYHLTIHLNGEEMFRLPFRVEPPTVLPAR